MAEMFFKMNDGQLVLDLKSLPVSCATSGEAQRAAYFFDVLWESLPRDARAWLTQLNRPKYKIAEVLLRIVTLCRASQDFSSDQLLRDSLGQLQELDVSGGLFFYVLARIAEDFPHFYVHFPASIQALIKPESVSSSGLSFDQVAQLFRIAVDKKSISAIHRLGLIIERRKQVATEESFRMEGIDQPLPPDYRWYDQAAAFYKAAMLEGNISAMYSLARLARNYKVSLSSEDRARARIELKIGRDLSANLMVVAARRGCVGAIDELAVRELFSGLFPDELREIGVHCVDQQLCAYKWYAPLLCRVAINQGCIPAVYHLAGLVVKGLALAGRDDFCAVGAIDEWASCNNNQYQCAAALYRVAIRAGCVEAIHGLAELVENNRILPAEMDWQAVGLPARWSGRISRVDHAAMLYQEAAKRGCVKSLNNLAAMIADKKIKAAQENFETAGLGSLWVKERKPGEHAGALYRATLRAASDDEDAMQEAYVKLQGLYELGEDTSMETLFVLPAYCSGVHTLYDELVVELEVWAGAPNFKPMAQFALGLLALRFGSGVEVIREHFDDCFNSFRFLESTKEIVKLFRHFGQESFKAEVCALNKETSAYQCAQDFIACVRHFVDNFGLSKALNNVLESYRPQVVQVAASSAQLVVSRNPASAFAYWRSRSRREVAMRELEARYGMDHGL